VESYTCYDDWGEQTQKPVLKIGVRQLDLVSSYTGHAYDAVLGVYYAKARMYDAANRRFVAVDPAKGTVANAQTLAQYTYCLGNPLRYTDPLGEAVTDWDREHLSAAELAVLEANTAAWLAANAAGDDAAKKAAHASSEAIREQYRTGTETGTGDGNTVGTPAKEVEKPPKNDVDTSKLGEENKNILQEFADAINSYSDGDLLDLVAEYNTEVYARAVAVVGSLNAGGKARAAAYVRQALIRDMAGLLANDSMPGPGVPDIGVPTPEPKVITPEIDFDLDLPEADKLLGNQFDDSSKEYLSLKPPVPTSVRPKNWKFIFTEWDKATWSPSDVWTNLEWLYKLCAEAKKPSDWDYIYEEVQKIRNKYRINGVVSEDEYGNTIIDRKKMQEYIERNGFFYSETAAVYAFGYVYRPISMEENREYGAVITRYNTASPDHSVFYLVVVKGPESGRSVDLGPAIRKNINNAVTTVHTHWDSNGSLVFSDDDYSIFAKSVLGKNFWNMYLVNREGEVIRTSRYYETDRKGDYVTDANGNWKLNYIEINELDYTPYIIFSVK